MNLYTEKMEAQLEKNRNEIARLKRAKPLLPIVEAMSKYFEDKGNFNGHWIQDNGVHFYVYAKKENDKSWFLMVRDAFLEFNELEEYKDEEYYKNSGEYTFHFRYTQPIFGDGEKPTLQVRVDNSAVCERVIIGTKVVDEVEYECGK